MTVLRTHGSRSNSFPFLKRAWLFGAICGFATGLFLVGVPAASAQITNQDDAFQKQVMPLLDRYCVECHMEDNAEAGIAFDRFFDQAEALRGRANERDMTRDTDLREVGVFG